MKKIIAVLLCLSMALCLASCGKGDGGASQSGEALKVGFLVGGDKYAYLADSALMGLEPFLAREVANSLGREIVELQVESEGALLSGLTDGSLDLAFGRLSAASSSLQGVNVTKPYSFGGLYFVTRKYDYRDSLKMPGSGQVGVMATVKAISSQVPGIDSVSVMDYENIDEMARDILSGKVGLGLTNEREAHRMISDAVQVQEVLSSPKESYVAALPQKSPIKGAVESVIDSYLTGKIRDSGEAAGTRGTEAANEASAEASQSAAGTQGAESALEAGPEASQGEVPGESQ